MALAHVTYYSQALGRTVSIEVFVPTDDKPVFPGMPVPVKQKPFKTLYLLHGFSGSYPDWRDGTRLLHWAEQHDLAVVMPSGENSFYVDDPDRGAYYGEWIGRELVEFTRNTFPLSDKREDTFIAGLSMGGYGAVRNGLKYHETFGYIGAFSAALIMDKILNSTDDVPEFFSKRSFFISLFGPIENFKGSDVDYFALVEKIIAEGKEVPKFYITCGTEDMLIDINRDYRDFLLSKGVEVFYEDGPGIHDWFFWDTYLPRFLDWLPLAK